MEDDLRQLTPSDYPVGLCEIPDPPKTLWIKGTLAPSGTKYLAVVGSRALSPYGRDACSALIQGLAGYPISIVSGLALGTDALAHESALRTGLHTVAIPGSGLGEKVISPRSNLDLAKRIVASGGALISEHPADYLPHPYDFPSRNRLMVGMSDAVLVIEAGAQSGTLITARLVGEYNRDLLCVPHRIGDVHGFGAHIFIRLGAAYITDSLHILEALGITPNEEDIERKSVALDGNEKIIYELLKEPHERDELIRISNIGASDVLTTLVMLELRGLIIEKYGAWRRI